MSLEGIEMIWYLFAVMILAFAALCLLFGLLKLGKQARKESGWTDPNVLPSARH